MLVVFSEPHHYVGPTKQLEKNIAAAEHDFRENLFMGNLKCFSVMFWFSNSYSHLVDWNQEKTAGQTCSTNFVRFLDV